MWSDMFHLGLPVAEKVLRPALVYAFLICALRLAGKRELAQLNPFDLVVLLTLSNAVQNAIIGDDNSVVGGIIGATTLLSINHLVVRFMYRHPRLERLVEGAPEVLVDKGVVRHKSLRRDLITLAELKAAARRQGFATLEEVDQVILEPAGTLTFLAKRPTPDVERHDEVLRALAELRERVEQLRPAQA